MSEAVLKKAFGVQLRKEREAAGLTQELLAFEAEVDRSYVSSLERGVKAPSVYMLFKLCGALGVAPAVFVARVDKLLQRHD